MSIFRKVWDFTTDKHFLVSSVIFTGSGTYIASTTDLNELGYGLIGAGVVELVAGIGSYIKGKREEEVHRRDVEDYKKTIKNLRRDLKRRDRKMEKSLEELRQAIIGHVKTRTGIDFDITDPGFELIHNTAEWDPYKSIKLLSKIVKKARTEEGKNPYLDLNDVAHNLSLPQELYRRLREGGHIQSLDDMGIILPDGTRSKERGPPKIIRPD